MPVTVARRERLLLTALLDRSSFPSLPWVAALRERSSATPSRRSGASAQPAAPEVLAGGLMPAARR